MQDENQRLQEKCKKLEIRVRDVDIDISTLNQYGRRKNIVCVGTLKSIEDKQLESTVTSIIKDWCCGRCQWYWRLSAFR